LSSASWPGLETGRFGKPACASLRYDPLNPLLRVQPVLAQLVQPESDFGDGQGCGVPGRFGDEGRYGSIKRIWC
jgi:hypothetical protein